MTTTTVQNGIDVSQLLQTIDLTTADPAAATFTFRASSSWEGGTHNVGRIHGFTHAGVEDGSRAEPFTLHGDEPPVRDAIANPVPVETTLEVV